MNAAMDGQFPGYHRTEWTNATIVEGGRTGYPLASGHEDLDGDGAPEFVVAGVYAYGLGDLRVFDWVNGTLVTRAETLWSGDGLWNFHAVGFFDVNGDGRKEIVVGGAVFLGADEGKSGVEVFSLNGTHLDHVAGKWWSMGPGAKSEVRTLFPPSLDDPPNATFTTFSFDASYQSFGSYLRAWALAANGTDLIEVSTRQINSTPMTAVALPCDASATRAIGHAFLGYEFLEVESTNQTTAVRTNATIAQPGFYWQAARCKTLSNGESFIVAAGIGTKPETNGATILVARLGADGTDALRSRAFLAKSLRQLFEGLPVHDQVAAPAVLVSGSEAMVLFGADYPTPQHVQAHLLEIRVHLPDLALTPVTPYLVSNQVTIYNVDTCASTPTDRRMCPMGGLLYGEPVVFVQNG